MVYFNRIGPYLAEAIAVFTLVFAGCGAIIANAKTHGSVTSLGIALTFGLAIGIMVYAVGHISGAHINPAVTLGLAATRHFPLARVPLYWLSQAIGATVAALLLRAIYGNVAHLGTTLPSGSDGQSLALEVVMTFFLVFVVMAVATDFRAVGQAAALAIGGAIVMGGLFGGPISGGSLNPARSFGPALVSGTWDHLWVYIVGPLAGGLLGALVYEITRGEQPTIEGVEDGVEASAAGR
jgi:MIP family channel proteins